MDDANVIYSSKNARRTFDDIIREFTNVHR